MIMIQNNVIFFENIKTMFIGLQPIKTRAELDSSTVDGLFETNILRVSPVKTMLSFLKISILKRWIFKAQTRMEKAIA